MRLSATQVSDAMRTMVGGTVVTQLRPDVGNQVDIRMIANDATRFYVGQNNTTFAGFVSLVMTYNGGTVPK